MNHKRKKVESVQSLKDNTYEKAACRLGENT